jgi:hypothetical protein
MPLRVWWVAALDCKNADSEKSNLVLLNRTGQIPDAFRVLEPIRGRTLLWALEDGFPAKLSLRAAADC